jgi:hypothetical protein
MGEVATGEVTAGAADVLGWRQELRSPFMIINLIASINEVQVPQRAY